MRAALVDPEAIVVAGHHASWGSRSDDRAICEPELGLYAIANASGPTYGGYHAPFGRDPGLDAFVASLRRSALQPPDALREAVAVANAAMYELSLQYERARAGRVGLDAARAATSAVRPPTWSRDSSHFCHFGSSLTAVAAAPQGVWVAQIGLCRAYVRDDSSTRVAVMDHSLASLMASAGAIDDDDRSSHRTVSTRLLGLGALAVIDVVEIPLRGDTTVLLCSPGVWNHEHGEEWVAALLVATPDAFRSSIQRFGERRPQGIASCDTTAIRLRVLTTRG